MAETCTDSREYGTSYVLVTAAYNEEALIQETIRSVIAQTILPTAWVIVSDGSTDRTDWIVQSYASRFSFIQLVRMEREQGRNFVSKVHAVREGISRLNGFEYQFIGNLDADLTFGPSYFQGLLDRFRLDSRLGVAGGWIHEEARGSFRAREFNVRESVPHAIQLLRRACYEAVGGYMALPHGGEDTCAVVTARMHGWKAQSFPELIVCHHRRTASAGGLLRNHFRIGMMDYSLGYHPAYEVLKCVGRVTERPYLAGAALRLVGFGSGYLWREPRLVSPEFVDFMRDDQRKRVRSLVCFRQARTVAK